MLNQTQKQTLTYISMGKRYAGLSANEAHEAQG